LSINSYRYFNLSRERGKTGEKSLKDENLNEKESTENASTTIQS